MAGQGERYQLPNGDRAKAQVHAQIARALDRRKVARFVVVFHARHKVFEHRLGARCPGRNAQCPQIGRLKPDVRQRGNGPITGGGTRSQATAVGVAVMARWATVAHLRQPGAQVGRKHAVGLAGLGQHLAPLENDMVFDAPPVHTLRGQSACHPCVTCQCSGLVVVGGKHGLGLQAGRQVGDFFRCHRVAHDQARLCLAGQGPQIGVQFHQAGLDKFDAPVSAGQAVQNAAVQHKHAMHLGARLQRKGERGVVGGAQIAPKPDQSGGVSGFHACR